MHQRRGATATTATATLSSNAAGLNGGGNVNDGTTSFDTIHNPNQKSQSRSITSSRGVVTSSRKAVLSDNEEDMTLPMGNGVTTISSTNGSASHSGPQQKLQLQQQQQQRRRVVRRRGRTKLSSSNNNNNSKYVNVNDDIQCIMMLVALVCFLIVAALYVLHSLWYVGSQDGLFGSWTSGNHRSKHPYKYTYTSSQHPPPQEKHHQDGEDFPHLPPNPIYTVPHSMPHIGDRSDEYATLRKSFDAHFPYQPERSLQALKQLRKYSNFPTFAEDLDYDIYNCPDEPPLNYPYEWKTLDVLNHWIPEETTTIPTQLHQGLCVFDYRKDYLKALKYRNAELPFVVTGDPEVAAAVERWNSPGYLDELMDPHVAHRAEISETNHFMYWIPGDAQRGQRPGKRHGRPPKQNPIEPEGWTSPTKMIRMTYPQFLLRANASTPVANDEMHWYFRLIGCGETGPTGNCDAGSSEWLFDELTFFQPRPHLLYLTEPSEQRGIHCRFGMQGVTIANHFDSSRNSIVVLGGERRYILSHPKHCSNMALYPKGHPSARHSAVDWSQPDLKEFPDFRQAYSNEVLLQAGDVLYLPTNWFHYIVSMGLNYQCNTRSGKSDHYNSPIHDCGF